MWVTRREGEPYVVQEGDPLPQREKLYKLGNSLAASGEVILPYFDSYYSGRKQAKQGFTSFRHIGGTGIVALQKKVHTTHYFY